MDKGRFVCLLLFLLVYLRIENYFTYIVPEDVVDLFNNRKMVALDHSSLFQNPPLLQKYPKISN